jgi:hypothetical protein
VFGLTALVEALLAPRRAAGDAPLPTADDLLEDIHAIEVRFDEAHRVRVAALLAGSGTLGQLLAASRAAGDPAEVRRLLVLRALWAWDPDEGDPLTVASSGALLDPEYQGQDFTVES